MKRSIDMPPFLVMEILERAQELERDDGLAAGIHHRQ
jgi:hypothetical protein